MHRIILAAAAAVALAASSVHAECDGAKPGIVKDSSTVENGTLSKGSSAPSGGADSPAPIKAKPLSRPQVRLAGGRLGFEHAC
jgi:hypothetical protein